MHGAGQVVVRRQLKRRSVVVFFQKLPPRPVVGPKFLAVPIPVTQLQKLFVAQKINALAAPNELVGLSAIWLGRVPILTVQEALSQRSVATYQPSSPNLSAIGFSDLPRRPDDARSCSVIRHPLVVRYLDVCDQKRGHVVSLLVRCQPPL